MRPGAFFCFSIYLLQTWIQIATCESKTKYVISPVEFHPKNDVAANVDSYESLIKKASEESVDMIVFPESTLFRRSNVSTLVPDPKDKVIPHSDEKYNEYKHIQQLSKAAAENEIYVVVNLREIEKNKKTSAKDSNDNLYNTNVVFDRNGSVIARYRKYNLFDEIGIKKPEEPELVTFDTDFGVTFGIFTCFDILFDKPAMDLVKKKKIENFIFPSMWFSELPFLTATQVQAGWSYSMNVNLVAAGANNPTWGSSGSGCYEKRKSFVQAMLEKEVTQALTCKFNNTTKSPVLQLADDAKASTTDNEAYAAGLKFKRDPTIHIATQKVLNESAGVFSDTLCSNDFCCNFSVKFKTSNNVDKTDHVYKAVAYKGNRFFGITTTGNVEYCAIVYCPNNKCGTKPSSAPYFLTFEEIEIDAIVDAENTLHFPSTLAHSKLQTDSNFYPMDYATFKYNVNQSDRAAVSIQLTEPNVNNLITFGIYVRNFNGANAVQLYGYLLIISVFVIRHMQ